MHVSEQNLYHTLLQNIATYQRSRSRFERLISTRVCLVNLFLDTSFRLGKEAFYVVTTIPFAAVHLAFNRLDIKPPVATTFEEVSIHLKRSRQYLNALIFHFKMFVDPSRVQEIAQQDSGIQTFSPFLARLPFPILLAGSAALTCITALTVPYLFRSLSLNLFRSLSLKRSLVFPILPLIKSIHPIRPIPNLLNLFSPISLVTVFSASIIGCYLLNKCYRTVINRARASGQEIRIEAIRSAQIDYDSILNDAHAARDRILAQAHECRSQIIKETHNDCQSMCTDASSYYEYMRKLAEEQHSKIETEAFTIKHSAEDDASLIRHLAQCEARIEKAKADQFVMQMKSDAEKRVEAMIKNAQSTIRTFPEYRQAMERATQSLETAEQASLNQTTAAKEQAKQIIQRAEKQASTRFSAFIVPDTSLGILRTLRDRQKDQDITFECLDGEETAHAFMLKNHEGSFFAAQADYLKQYGPPQASTVRLTEHYPKRVVSMMVDRLYGLPTQPRDLIEGLQLLNLVEELGLQDESEAIKKILAPMFQNNSWFFATAFTCIYEEYVLKHAESFLIDWLINQKAIHPQAPCVEKIMPLHKKVVDSFTHKLLETAFERYTTNNPQAIPILEAAVRLRNIEAMALLGRCYLFGTCGVERNVLKAVELIRDADQAGSAHGLYLLGYCYLTGTGVKKDENRAITYFGAAGNSWSEAYLDLGHVYFGYKNYEQAFEAYRRCEPLPRQFPLNYQYLYWSLGLCYRDGLGTERDLSQAKSYFQKGADRGCKEAQECLKAMN